MERRKGRNSRAAVRFKGAPVTDASRANCHGYSHALVANSEWRMGRVLRGTARFDGRTIAHRKKERHTQRDNARKITSQRPLRVTRSPFTLLLVAVAMVILVTLLCCRWRLLRCLLSLSCGRLWGRLPLRWRASR